jgi:hypothetical protein
LSGSDKRRKSVEFVAEAVEVGCGEVVIGVGSRIPILQMWTLSE